MPKMEVPFNEEFRELVLDMDFEYFLNEDLTANKVSDSDRTTAEQAYLKTTLEVQERYRKNKKQCRLWLEGIVRLQWFGGMLPSQLRLDGSTRDLTYFDYEEVGRNWAWFAYWQKLERKRRFWKVSWDRVTKVGAVLAIVLTVLKLLETFFPKQ
ncbi:hypothetical protein GUA46_06820 [Muricauda sp. HICW]|uniref:Uncharacterized protein n=1 Tax=Flagellimonas chongwuensis TaxID=2697365 RepID=A0A850NFK9_9FLAO|nr:hypothetical protein [Allomuricauda chongwuensis]NVN18046.1 hypothetical protein [Allomuricauda chongwuensis]